MGGSEHLPPFFLPFKNYWDENSKSTLLLKNLDPTCIYIYVYTQLLTAKL